MLEIIPVQGRRARRQFLAVPKLVYAGDPAWVPPLRIERRQHFSQRNPFFNHARWRAWIACRAGRPVGRISAQIDAMHLERYQDATGFFGALEAMDDPEIFENLLGTAEEWLRQQGMRRIRGPFNLSINQECGLLIEGFESPPMIMMGHARPYFRDHIESLGYAKAVDLVAFHMSPKFEPARIMQRLADRVLQGDRGPRVEIRHLRRHRFDEELAILRDIFNDAWRDNWGFVPFTEEEFQEIGTVMRFLLDDEWVIIAEVDGEPAAMMVVLPNINEAIRDLGGRLMPIGWLKLLWRLKVSYPKTIRVPLMGVRQQFQNTRLGPA